MWKTGDIVTFTYVSPWIVMLVAFEESKSTYPEPLVLVLRSSGGLMWVRPSWLKKWR